MRTMLKPLFLAVMLVTLWSAVAKAQVSPENQLAIAEAKWLANKPQVYEFSFKLFACCVIRVTGPGSEPMVFRVENGVGKLTGIWAGRPPQATQGMDKYSTIDKVVASIHEELAKRPYRLEIDYDPNFGYPRRFFVKRFENAADDDYTLMVENFRPLARQ